MLKENRLQGLHSLKKKERHTNNNFKNTQINVIREKSFHQNLPISHSAYLAQIQNKILKH